MATAAALHKHSCLFSHVNLKKTRKRNSTIFADIQYLTEKNTIKLKAVSLLSSSVQFSKCFFLFSMCYLKKQFTLVTNRLLLQHEAYYCHYHYVISTIAHVTKCTTQMIRA